MNLKQLRSEKLVERKFEAVSSECELAPNQRISMRLAELDGCILKIYIGGNGGYLLEIHTQDADGKSRNVPLLVDPAVIAVGVGDSHGSKGIRADETLTLGATVQNSTRAGTFSRFGFSDGSFDPEQLRISRDEDIITIVNIGEQRNILVRKEKR